MTNKKLQVAMCACIKCKIQCKLGSANIKEQCNRPGDAKIERTVQFCQVVQPSAQLHSCTVAQLHSCTSSRSPSHSSPLPRRHQLSHLVNITMLSLLQGEHVCDLFARPCLCECPSFFPFQSPPLRRECKEVKLGKSK